MITRNFEPLLIPGLLRRITRDMREPEQSPQHEAEPRPAARAHGELERIFVMDDDIRNVPDYLRATTAMLSHRR